VNFTPTVGKALGKGSTLAVQRARIWSCLADPGEQRKRSGAMSESVVFELKLQIQHLEEKLTFLAGGTNGAELVEVVMEKDEELEKNHKNLKETEANMFRLADEFKRVDSQRRELLREKEQLRMRVTLVEEALARQVEQSVELREQV
ncbi:unnamed protein product, partial [Laminaria digitata]